MYPRHQRIIIWLFKVSSSLHICTCNSTSFLYSKREEWDQVSSTYSHRSLCRRLIEANFFAPLSSLRERLQRANKSARYSIYHSLRVDITVFNRQNSAPVWLPLAHRDIISADTRYKSYIEAPPWSILTFSDNPGGINQTKTYHLGRTIHHAQSMQLTFQFNYQQANCLIVDLFHNQQIRAPTCKIPA